VVRSPGPESISAVAVGKELEQRRPMSKRINVNPGQYKVAGRERMGESLGQEKNKQTLAKDKEKAGQKKKGNKA